MNIQLTKVLAVQALMPLAFLVGPIFIIAVCVLVGGNDPLAAGGGAGGGLLLSMSMTAVGVAEPAVSIMITPSYRRWVFRQPEPVTKSHTSTSVYS